MGPPQGEHELSKAEQCLWARLGLFKYPQLGLYCERPEEEKNWDTEGSEQNNSKNIQKETPVYEREKQPRKH